MSQKNLIFTKRIFIDEFVLISYLLLQELRLVLYQFYKNIDNFKV